MVVDCFIGVGDRIMVEKDADGDTVTFSFRIKDDGTNDPTFGSVLMRAETLSEFIAHLRVIETQLRGVVVDDPWDDDNNHPFFRPARSSGEDIF